VPFLEEAEAQPRIEFVHEFGELRPDQRPVVAYHGPIVRVVGVGIHGVQVLGYQVLIVAEPGGGYAAVEAQRLQLVLVLGGVEEIVLGLGFQIILELGLSGAVQIRNGSRQGVDRLRFEPVRWVGRRHVVYHHPPRLESGPRTQVSGGNNLLHLAPDLVHNVGVEYNGCSSRRRAGRRIGRGLDRRWSTGDGVSWRSCFGGSR